MNRDDNSRDRLGERFEQLPERALVLADRVGTSLRQVIPDGAEKWFRTGVAYGTLKSSSRAASGAMKHGGKVAGSFVKRNPAALAAAAIGIGALWLVARHRARDAQNGAGTRVASRSRRVDARRNNGKASSAGAGAARKPAARKPRSRTQTTTQ